MQSTSESTERKKLMVLGVGEAQLNLIRAAKEQGYFVIACDMRGEMEGAKLADQFLQVNYSDKEAILRIAREERINGIISNSEAAMLNVAYVSEQMGLPGNSVESVERLVSKHRFRELQRKTGMFAPLHFVTASSDEFLNEIRQSNFPVIVKPSESSGTRGTSKLMQYDEAAAIAAFQTCKTFSRDGKVVVEEFIEMAETFVFEADVFVVGGEILWDGCMTTYRSRDLPMVPMTYVFPPVAPEAELTKIKKAVEAILRAADIRHGEYNAEAYLTSGGQVFIIEINARQGGNHIPRLVLEHTGVDFTKLLVTTAVGDGEYYRNVKSFKRENRNITLHIVFGRKDGIYNGLHIDPEIQEYVRWQTNLIPLGEKVAPAMNAGDALAYVDLCFDSREQQRKYMDKMEKYITPILVR